KNAFALHRGRPLRLTAALVPVLLVALSACSTPNPPPDDDGLSLQGLWLVEPDPGTDYGSQATTTLEFGSAASGSATFLSQVDANDITICEKHVFAIL